MWLSAIKLAVSAGSKIYANKQKAKVAMSDAQLLHAERQARGEEAYQGKLLEARQNDYKDEFVLVILSAPIIVLAWGVFSEDPGALLKTEEKNNEKKNDGWRNVKQSNVQSRFFKSKSK
jgi:uncharacterized ion transporter superfamily protein YfcC